MNWFQERSKVLLAALAAVLCALIVGVALTAEAYSVRNNEVVVAIVTDDSSRWNGTGKTVALWESHLHEIPALGDDVKFDARFPSQKVVARRWGPFLNRGAPNLQVLVILESAEGCCADWNSVRDRTR